MAIIMGASITSVPHTERTSACMTVGTVVTSVVHAIALHASPVITTDQAEWDTVVAVALTEAGITATSMDVETTATTDMAVVEVLTDVLTTVITVDTAVAATSTEIADQLTVHATRDV